jgi:hypothetical protein
MRFLFAVPSAAAAHVLLALLQLYQRLLEIQATAEALSQGCSSNQPTPSSNQANDAQRGRRSLA